MASKLFNKKNNEIGIETGIDNIGSFLIFENDKKLYSLTSAITGDATLTVAPSGSLATTSNPTGIGKIFISDGSKWQEVGGGINYGQNGGTENYAQTPNAQGELADSFLKLGNFGGLGGFPLDSDFGMTHSATGTSIGNKHSEIWFTHPGGEGDRTIALWTSDGGDNGLNFVMMNYSDTPGFYQTYLYTNPNVFDLNCDGGISISRNDWGQQLLWAEHRSFNSPYLLISYTGFHFSAMPTTDPLSTGWMFADSLDGYKLKISQGAGGLPYNIDKRVLTNVTNSTATMANITDLSVTLIAGKTYTFKLILFVADSVSGEGFGLDFDGGTATATNVRIHCRITDASLELSQQSTSLATDFQQATITGDTLVEVYGTITVNAGGTFIPRFAQNSHLTGTATVYRGSHLSLKCIS